jgi:hypothetical protein
MCSYNESRKTLHKECSSWIVILLSTSTKSHGESENELRKKVLTTPEKWKNIDLADIPLKEFKTRTTKPSETRGRTLTRKSKSPKKKSRSRSPKECCVCLEKSEDTLKCKHTICVD